MGNKKERHFCATGFTQKCHSLLQWLYTVLSHFAKDILNNFLALFRKMPGRFYKILAQFLLPYRRSEATNWCLSGWLPITCHCETSPQTGRGNPPVEWSQVTITTKNRRNPHFLGADRYISPLTGGLPHQSADWFAMTVYTRQTLICRFAELNIFLSRRDSWIVNSQLSIVNYLPCRFSFQFHKKPLFFLWKCDKI